jgi:hypothetical protein
VIAGAISMIGAVAWVVMVGPLETVDWGKQIKPSRIGLDVAPLTSSARP